MAFERAGCQQVTFRRRAQRLLTGRRPNTAKKWDFSTFYAHRNAEGEGEVNKV